MSIRMLALCGSVLFWHSGNAAREPFTPATPESQGLSSKALESLASDVKGYCDSGMLVGAELLVIKNRRAVLHRSFGWDNREEKKPMALDTIFSIRSMTKAVTGAAVQILVDEGKLKLDDKVSKYISAFDSDKSRAITVRQLLTHRSGLPLTILTRMDEYPSLQAMVDATGKRGPQFPPGSKYWYSDAGADTAAAIVEKVSEMPFDRFVAKLIFAPLGMRDSLFPPRGNDSRGKRFACLYAGAPRAWVRWWKPGSKPVFPFAWGSQTMYSTPADYARFLTMWTDHGKGVLSKAAVKRIVAPVSSMKMLGMDAEFPTGFESLTAYYGQMSVLHARGSTLAAAKVVVFGHSGSDGTAAWAIPSQDLIVCLFTQSRGSTAPIRFEESIGRVFLGMRGRSARPSARYAPYVGTYTANFATFKNSPFQVIPWNHHLALDIPDQLVYDLKEPDEAGRWRFAISPEVAVSFKRDASGKVTAMVLYQSGASVELPRR